MYRRLLLAIAFLPTWAAPPLAAQEKPGAKVVPKALAHDADLDPAFQGLEQSLQKLIDEKKTPGIAVGIIQNDRLAYAHGFGLMKVDDPGRPITTQTLFHMASITKPFVAT